MGENTVLSPARAPSTAPQAEAAFDVADTQALVVSNTAVNSDYFHMVLEADGLAAQARAGQFFNIACPATGNDLPYLRRPMSVYRAAPAKGQVEFLYKVTGAGTRGLATVRAGDSVAILGPLGNGFTLDPRWKNIVVLGRGVGLATLAPLAELAAEQGVGVTAILSARSRALVMSVERFAKSGAAVEVVTDEDGSSEPAAVEKLLERLIVQGKADAFFTCGSNRLMLLMKRVGEKHGIPGEVAMEQQMACGLGMCFCCVRSFATPDGDTEQRRVCLEGPVFALREALSW
ncbi:MAG: dihydroorotate dehydrogenase electron transfer subunit [Pseudolabrys sp.]|nr:dihydroorotate dehydrogenase electron transfer subunit [Pseudolabrys sp.]MCW5684126.1 dihydroorotate dehydrogenase electron transfer subunit [Pseudolabrys sp.]